MHGSNNANTSEGVGTSHKEIKGEQTHGSKGTREHYKDPPKTTTGPNTNDSNDKLKTVIDGSNTKGVDGDTAPPKIRQTEDPTNQ